MAMGKRLAAPPQANRVRRSLAGALRALADRLHDTPCPTRDTVPSIDFRRMPFAARLDFQAMGRGTLALTYSAFDPIWGDGQPHDDLIGLRDHLKRLSFTANELASLGVHGEWWAVTSNLRMAASLQELAADTDLDQTTWMCGSAADYEAANGELTEKHLAGVIVFNLVWTAYECAVEAASGPYGLRQPRGARGRELMFRMKADRLPYLRRTVIEALSVTQEVPDFAHVEMRRAITARSWAAIGAEHLRQFRNAMTHGAVPKPKPKDWGRSSRYQVDEDPAITQFASHIRLTLMLIQILAVDGVGPKDTLAPWRFDEDPALALLSQLHCDIEDGDQLPLDLPDAHIITGDERW